jgi:hypothetical protein
MNFLTVGAMLAAIGIVGIGAALVGRRHPAATGSRAVAFRSAIRLLAVAVLLSAVAQVDALPVSARLALGIGASLLNLLGVARLIFALTQRPSSAV